MNRTFLWVSIIAGIMATGCRKSETTPAPTPTPVAPVTVTTVAGSTAGYADGTGTAAQFNVPAGVVRDAAGNLFVTDRDNHRVRKITAAGVVTTFAGNGSPGFVNGTGIAAQFNQPYGIAIDASGNLYVADRLNYVVRKITPAGVVTTLAGSTQGYADGTGTAAQFNELYGIAADAAGNLYVPDFFNHRIRKISPAGVVTTIAGSGSPGLVNGTGTAASFNSPFGIGADAAGNIFVADYYNHAIRKVTAAGVVTTIAGTGTPGSADGAGAVATFRQPSGIIADGSGVLYVTDAMNHTIRKILGDGTVSTLAGSTDSGNTDGTGTSARFNTPIALFGDFTGKAIYVADFGNNRVRKIILP